jgi:hypothetical protein
MLVLNLELDFSYRKKHQQLDDEEGNESAADGELMLMIALKQVL